MLPETKARSPLVPIPVLSVVVPVFDEAAVLERSLERLLLVLERWGRAFELVCVDDGSRDGSRALLAEAARRDPRLRVLGFERNRGKGAAVRAGVLAARGDYVLFTDADLAADPTAIEALLAALEGGAPLVFASRRAPGARIDRPQSLVRMLLGRLFSRFARYATGLPLHDVTCGLKGFAQPVARELFSAGRVDGWAFDAELAALAAARGIPIVELGVRWRAGEKSAVRLVPAALEAALDLVHIAVRRRLGASSTALPASRTLPHGDDLGLGRPVSLEGHIPGQ